MSKKDMCLVLLPFNKQSNTLWESIKKVGRRFQHISLERNEGAPRVRSIQESTVKITQAAFLIADFSLEMGALWPDPNILTEAGAAVGLEKKLYVLSNIPRHEPLQLPLYWHSFRVTRYQYDPKYPEDFEKWFEEYLEIILRENHLNPARVLARRETQAQKLNWLTLMVQQACQQAKEIYQDEAMLWNVGAVQFNPFQCTFNLTHKVSHASEGNPALIELQCGAYFQLWKRQGSPFWIRVRYLDREVQELEVKWEEITLTYPLESISSEEVWNSFERKLDIWVKQITPNASPLTSLSKLIQNMGQIAENLTGLTIEGLMLYTKQKMTWNTNGYRIPFYLEDQSEVTLCIDFQQWEEQDSPFWIYFKPTIPYLSEVENWFTETVPIYTGSGWLIKIITAETKMAHILDAFQYTLQELMNHYQRARQILGPIALPPAPQPQPQQPSSLGRTAPPPVSSHSPHAHTRTFVSPLNLSVMNNTPPLRGNTTTASPLLTPEIQGGGEEDWGNVQNWSKEGFGSIGNEGKQAVSALFDSAFKESSNRNVRDKALGTGIMKTIPALIHGLKDDEYVVRRESAESLGEMGVDAPEVIYALIQSLGDEHKEVRKKVAWALGKIGLKAKNAVPSLIEALKDENTDVRYWAGWALGEIGTEAKEYLSKLIEALKDKNEDVREKVGLVLGKIGPSAKEAVPALIETLKDSSEEVVKKAAWALGRIGPETKEVVPALIEALKSESAHVRYGAGMALGEIGPAAKEAVPSLIVALKDKDPDVRKKAALALGEIGPEAKEAISDLTAILKDEDYGIRYIGAEALKKIKGKEFLSI
jgi:HEAT repeat protein